MKNSSFYDLTAVSFSDRETFNNAILLLSMVKSEAYYIIGFSRLNKKIDIGFNFQSVYNSAITEIFTMDLNEPHCICFKSKLRDLNLKRCRQLVKKSNCNFHISGNDVLYECRIERDEIIPISIENVDNIIKNIKREIVNFIEEYFESV